MADDKSTGRLSLINASGFLLQLAVEDHIRKGSGRLHNWELLAREHPWREPQSGQEGFIDLLVHMGAYRLVVECKRPQDSEWVFLAAHTAEPNVIRARGRWVIGSPGEKPGTGWFDFGVSPSSYEAAFCVVRGTGEGDKPMLERVADVLLTSLNCLAAEELALSRPGWDRLRIYFPVIITTARLSVCKVDPEAVTLEDGKLPKVPFEEVPMVRFHKTLSTDLVDDFSPRDLKSANENRERTILIINAASLSKILAGLNPQHAVPFEGWPWRQESP
jgi:hypothetical protein